MSWDQWNGEDSPWGKKPNRPNSNIVDDLINESKKQFNKFANKEGGDKSPNKPNFEGKQVLYIFVILFFTWLASGFFIVQSDEEAIVTTFGKYSHIAYPGPNYHWPSPFQEIIKRKVTIIQRHEIGFRSGSNNENLTVKNNKLEESLMLTKDENITDINFVVQWKINNFRDYEFNIVDPENTVRDAAESAMREIVGQTPFSKTQTDGRSEVEAGAKILLQEMLNTYGAGIDIVNLQLLKVDPPIEVIDAFRDVQAARADMEREINQAYAYKNDIIPRARGNAAEILQNAEAYKETTVNRSLGETKRFNAVYLQYAKAKETTKKRIYLETMENILKDTNKTIIDSKVNILPYLNLKDIK